MSLHVTTIMTR